MTIDHLFFSHLHPDHTGDLAAFLFATKYAYGSTYGSFREKPLYLWGGEGFTEFFDLLRAAFKDWIVPDALNVGELQEGVKDFSCFTIGSVRTPHIESSLAYRIDAQGKSVVYSGDTDYSESFIELATDTDLLLIECALASDDLTLKGHLSPSKAIDIINKSGARKAVVTHLYPQCDAYKVVETIRAGVDVEIVEARDLLEIEV